MRVKLIVCVLGVAMTGCGDDMESSPPPAAPLMNAAVVYEAGPHLRQCAAVAVTRTQSAAKLTAAGIQVLRSSCGHIEGVFYPTVCGAGTPEILLHDIPAASVVAAEAAGFRSVDTLNVWRRDTCPQYLFAIEQAQAATSCVEVRNRVMAIQNALQPEERLTLLDQAGNCADAGYKQVLYGGDTGDVVQCSNTDSIAGPRKSCPLSARAAMFNTILANLGQADLGLGSNYYVSQVYPAN
jgi:hypothetical protein